MAFSHFKQQTNYTCGPACLRMILGSFGIKKSEKWLAHFMKTNKKIGTKTKYFPGLAKYFHLKSYHKHHTAVADIVRARKNGYEIIVLFYLPDLQEAHYSVVKKIDRGYIHFHDPWYGARYRLAVKTFVKNWHDNTLRTTRVRWFFAVKNY